MTNFNHLKNFCEFIINADSALQEFSASTKRHVFIEHAYNLLQQADVASDMAATIASMLANSVFVAGACNHFVDINGDTFYTANIIDKYTGEDYDMTVIFKDTDDTPQLIDYYYGDPNVRHTKMYAELWLNNNH